MCNRRLYEISLTSSTDSTELLGSFENMILLKISASVDSMTSAVRTATRSLACARNGKEAVIASALLRHWKSIDGIDTSVEITMLDPFASAFKNDKFESLYASLKFLVKESVSRNVKMFEWVDGILLRALERMTGSCCITQTCATRRC